MVHLSEPGILLDPKTQQLMLSCIALLFEHSAIEYMFTHYIHHRHAFGCMQHVWVLVYININYTPEICFVEVCNDVPFVSPLGNTTVFSSS